MDLQNAIHYLFAAGFTVKNQQNWSINLLLTLSDSDRDRLTNQRTNIKALTRMNSIIFDTKMTNDQNTSRRNCHQILGRGTFCHPETVNFN